jgi:hypothetical protein
MRRAVIAFACGFLAVPAFAQDKPTVESLLKQGYDVIGVFPSNAGPGLLLQFSDEDGNAKLMMCFVAETPQSAEVTTQYCKPVR